MIRKNILACSVLALAAIGLHPSPAQEKAEPGKEGSEKPDEAETLFKTGESLYRRGRDAEEGRLPRSELDPVATAAVETFKELVRNHPRAEKAAQGAFFLGSSYLLLDDLEKARAAYQRVFDEYPGFKDRALALYRVGVCQAGLDEPARAREAFQRIPREFPDLAAEVKRARKSLDELSIVGRPAPRIQAAHWLNGIAGEEGVSTFRGEVVVVIFLATWCTNCEKELPRLRWLIERLTPRGVIFLAVLNPDDPENSGSVESYLMKSALEFVDVALDPREASWPAYRVSAFPAGVAIDRKGVVRWRGHPSFLSRPLLEKLADER